MRIFALELNNDIKGIGERKKYIESLISILPSPDLVLLPELSICSYIPNQRVWKYADCYSIDTSAWAMKIAAKFNTFVGVGYLDYEKGDYFNRYMIADGKQVYGIVTKSEGEAAVFKRGWFDSIIKTPFGNVAVAICYDARRKHFYENIKDEEISLIVFPQGSPANPKKGPEETAINDYICNLYVDAFGVPVIYINSFGKLEHMPGIMGLMMKLAGFRMNGKTEIYALGGEGILHGIKGVKGHAINLSEKKRKKDIEFFGRDLIKGNFLFRHFILAPDILMGIRLYNKGLKKCTSYKA